MDCDIVESDLVVPDVCPILGIPLFKSENGRTPNSYSIDRVKNDLGYVKGNCRIISSRANSLKSDMTVAQVERLLEYMKGNI